MSLTWPSYWLDEIDSTNEEAKRRARRAGFGSQWIAARSQSAGRGRMGRDWVSPAGNLYATALFRWGGELPDMTRVPFATALAVSDTVATLAPQADPKLKWPNDVRCDGAKVSGILVETSEAAGVRWVAVGIGINVAFSPEGLGQVTTCLADLRGDAMIDTGLALQTLREAFAWRLEQTEADFSDTRLAWLERAEGLGKPVRVNVNGVAQEGAFKDIAADGALVLQLRDGRLQTIRSGDVEVIREVSGN